MLRLSTWGALIVALVVVEVWPAVARAQARSLSWDAIHVQAELDNDGRLYVTETQVMRFDGAWNGGERTFRVAPEHSIVLLSMHEITSDRGKRAYVPGTLANVGEYAFTGRHVLRWRARASDAAPFHDEARTFELRYVLSGVVVSIGADYVLNHDFAFRDRQGVIDRFSATLRLDSAWQPMEPLPATIEASNLAPGESVVRRIALRYIGSGEPAGAASRVEGLGLPPSRSTSATLFGFLLLLAAGMVASFLHRERASGHLEPSPALALVDRQWLERHVFCHPAEVIGAAWDRRIGPTEVAALLARLTGEGKLCSSVEPALKPNHAPVLKLELRRDRESFHGYERALIDGLFFDGDTTDTTRIREHYEGRGFDPAGLIEPGLETEVAGLFGRQETPPRWYTTLTAAVTLPTSMVLLATVQANHESAPWALSSVSLILLGWAFARFHACRYRDTVVEVSARARKTAFSALLPLIWLASVYLAFDTELSSLQLGLLALLTLAACWNITQALKPRELAASYRLRRQIAVARAYFARELESAVPRIDDAWFPYLIAFDLGPDMAEWFRAFAGTHSTGSTWHNDSCTASAPQTWSGGGGMFGSAGASDTWTIAASTIAAGVSAPSSSSSSSGSSSSGGGGGGGW